jgi:hypothetical protein
VEPGVETPQSELDRTTTREPPAPESPTPPSAAAPVTAVRADRPSENAEDHAETEPEPPVDQGGEPAPLRVFTGLAAGLSSGVIPNLAPTLALTLGMTRRALCAALHLGYAPSQQARLDTPAGAAGSVALAYASLDAGILLRALDLEFPLSAGIETGFFVARGDVPEHQTRALDWLATYVSTGVSHTWSDQFRLLLRLEGLLSLRRPSFALDLGMPTPRVFHRPSPVAARIYLGAEVVLQ